MTIAVWDSWTDLSMTGRPRMNPGTDRRHTAQNNSFVSLGVPDILGIRCYRLGQDKLGYPGRQHIFRLWPGRYPPDRSAGTRRPDIAGWGIVHKYPVIC